MSLHFTRALGAIASTLVLCHCASAQGSATSALTQNAAPEIITGTDGVKLAATPLETFASAWAMTFVPDGRAIVTEKVGDIWLLSAQGKKLGKVSNAPTVDPRGQGGMGDFIVHPDFAENGTVFISYVERDADDDSLSGAAVERATLTLSGTGGALSNRQVIWRQAPKVEGNGHYGHRLAVSPDGYLFISSGERQKFNPAQNMAMNLGKIIRINQDGTVPEDNPFYGNGAAANEVWTLGHRNPLGIAFDSEGRLWEQEMGPKGGDELNLIIRSKNYGYPFVSEGEHYNGTKIPSHASMPIFEAPAVAWVPAISPAGLMFYDGDTFADWKGDAFIGGLSSQALVRVSFEPASGDGDAAPEASEAARYEWGKRIREPEQGPDGAIYVLEDREGGRLLRLTPAE
jgi:aldose sugar dehydrogenase